MNEQTKRVVTVEDLPGGAKAKRDRGARNHVGAFEEDALNTLDAANCSGNLAEGQTLEEPTFLDDEGPCVEIPTFITKTNVRELFGLRSGETLSEAIARHNAKKG